MITIEQAKLEVVAELPEGYFLENLAVRAYRSILVSAMNKNELWYIPAPREPSIDNCVRLTRPNGCRDGRCVAEVALEDSHLRMQHLGCPGRVADKGCDGPALRAGALYHEMARFPVAP